MIEIDLKINYDKISKALLNISGKLTDLSPLTKKIAGAMEDAVAQNFEDEGNPKWKPLAPSTIKSRRSAREWPGQILKRTGRLSGAIESSYTPTSALVFVSGTRFPYSLIHQFGGDIWQAARQQVIHFKKNKKSGRVRFAKSTTQKQQERASFAQKVNVGAMIIHIPARPYLTLSNTDLAEITDDIRIYLRNL